MDHLSLSSNLLPPITHDLEIGHCTKTKTQSFEKRKNLGSKILIA
jgi:hypothetical protein